MPYEKLKEEHYTNLGGQDGKISQYATQEGEALNIFNMDFTKQGAWSKVPGTGLYVGASVSGRITGLFQFTHLNGASYVIATANTTVYSVTPSGFNALISGTANGLLWDFVAFVDRLFLADGQDFYKTDGINSSFYSLPPGQQGFSVSGLGTGGFTGSFQYAYGYLNDRGYMGPASVVPASIAISGVSGVAVGGMTFPAGYGITSIIVYRSDNNLFSLFEIGTLSPPGPTFIDAGVTLSDTPAPFYTYLTLTPRYIEVFNNQLFLAGFSSQLSTVYFSGIGEPEGIGATAFFEVRTNDGDRVTGMKNYFNQLVLFKQRSFHQLLGDNPNNFTLNQISDQYGCLSNRATAVYNDILVFLDRKGVAQFNGANTQIISNKMEDVFLRMNITAALDQAAMLHVKERNEIWTIFPIDGATMNNAMVVYDYLANSWYERHGLNISSIALAITDRTFPTPMYGGYTGNIFVFGASLMGDGGMGMTCSILSKFHSPMGNSTEKMFRRLWLDVDPESMGDPSAVVNVSLYKNHDLNNAVATFLISGATFQTRIDFGVSAKSLAFGFNHVSATSPLRINGYSLGYRYQRNV